MELNELEQLSGGCGISLRPGGGPMEGRVPLDLMDPGGRALTLLYNSDDGTHYVRLSSDDGFEVDRTVGVAPLHCALEYDAGGRLVGIDLSGPGPSLG